VAEDLHQDLIALIRYGAKPGDGLRPLVEIKRPFWQIRAPADLAAVVCSTVHESTRANAAPA
jgi:hypothetical protein